MLREAKAPLQEPGPSKKYFARGALKTTCLWEHAWALASKLYYFFLILSITMITIISFLDRVPFRFIFLALEFSVHGIKM